MNKELFVDASGGRFDEIIKHAQTCDPENTLYNAMSGLFRRMLNGTKVVVYNDPSPLSLYFETYRDGNFAGNGGIIYHGPHDAFGAGGVAAHVCLNKTEGWSCHT